MSFSFPKPHKPNNSAERTGPANTVLVTEYDGRTGAKVVSYTWTNQPESANCNRSYGSGYPLLSIGPNKWFKRCSSYKIFAKRMYKTHGQAIVTSDDTGITVVTYSGTSTRSYREAYPGVSPWFTYDDYVEMPSNVRIRLGTEVMMKVGGKKASFGEALAESGKTIHHLTKTAIDLLAAIRAAKRGKWRDVAKHLRVRPKDFHKGKTTSERWLEYQYGWKPLMSDIYDAAQLVQKGFREKTHLASSERHLKDSYSYKSEFTSGSKGVPGFVRGESKADYTAKVFYKINESTLSKLGQMGLINPLSVAWEVVPFSFVVDWFLPVGNFLEALTARLGVDFVDGYFGVKAELAISHCDPQGDAYRASVISDDRLNKVDYFGYTRQTMIGFPVPGLYFKSPFSSTHALNALALISQLTGKRH